MSKRARHDGKARNGSSGFSSSGSTLRRRLIFESLEDRYLLAVVTSLTDNGSGGLTLREAVAGANSGEVITFAPSLYASGPVTIQLVNQPSSDPDHIRVERSMTIQGPGAHLITIRAYDDSPTEDNNDGGRIFNIGDSSSSFINVTISGLTLTGGDPVLTDAQTGSGGAIRNMENLTILNCVISDSYTSNGGAVSNASGSGTLTITDSIISGNRAEDGGGILMESGSANITRTRFEGNYARNLGGAIINRGSTVTITDSTFNANGAGEAIIPDPMDPIGFNGAGGAVATYGGTLTITGTTISGNFVGNQGGAIFNENSTVAITNSTISGNSADIEGGAIYNKFTTNSALTIRNSTITGNSVLATGSSGGIFNGTGATNPALIHTILAGNFRGTNTPDDVAGSISAQFSLIGLKGSATIVDNGGNNIGIASPINAMLGPLANNGGPTMTHALLAGSPAIDAGNSAAVAGSGNVPLFDQRGTSFARIVDGDNTGGARIDIGAYERVFANNPPTNPAAVALAAINEDLPNASNAGTLVSAIITASGSTDSDGNSLGIAVTAADNANGQWEYSTNAGGSWLNLSSVSTASARLLAPAHLVRFVPNANFNSQVGASPTIDFKVWDQTSGTAGLTGDTTSNSAYSASAAQATQSVTAVNDAPSFTLPATLVQRNEDAGAVTINGFATNLARGPATATDEATQTLTFLVNVTGTTGNLAFTSAPAIDPTTGALTFTLASNANGSATVDVVLQDNGSGTSPNANSSSAQTFTIEVAAVNDAPSFTLPATLVQRNEDAGAVTINGFATSIAPGPATATDETAQTVTFVLSVTGSTGNLAFTSAPAIDPATGALTFTLASNTNGSATVDVVLQDNGSGTSPNVNSSAVQTFTIDVAPVNDEQILATNNGLALGRGSNAVIAASLLETTDIDDVPNDLVYAVTSGPTQGMLLVSGIPAAQFTQQQINAGLVSYQHDGTAILSDSFGFTVDDGEGTASSGTFQITIQPFAGDYNGNSTVDAADYVLWRKTLNTTVATPYSGADGDGSGVIDPGDYTVWRSNFGDVLTPGAGSGLPAAGSSSLERSSADSSSGSANAAVPIASLAQSIAETELNPVLSRESQATAPGAALDLLLTLQSAYTAVESTYGDWTTSDSEAATDHAAVDAALDESCSPIALAIDLEPGL